MSITWNGVSSDTIGVIVERIPNRYVPTRRFSPQQVAGRNGNILLVDKAFPNVEQEYEVYLSAEAQGLPAVARACAEWLMGPDGYCRLTDSYNTTVYREAFLLGGFDIENILNKFGRCTITFSCKPQKHLLTGDTPISIPAGSTTTYTGSVVQFDGITSASITSLSTTITPTQAGSGDPSPTNVRLITGLAGLSVYRTGKNILPNLKYQYNADNASIGQNVAYTNENITLSAGTYTLSITHTITTTPRVFYRHNGTTSLLGRLTVPGTDSFTFTADGGTYSFYVYETTGVDADDITQFQLELGSTATTYEPYDGNTYSVDWSTQAGTVYHGTVDPVAGQLIVDSVKLKISDLTWDYTNNVFRSNSVMGTEQTGNVIACSAYSVANKATPTDNRADMSINFGATGTAVRRIYVKDSRYNGSTLNDWLSEMGSVEIVRELANPLTYQFTPQEIGVLVGTNNVWLSDGNVSLTVATPLGGIVTNPTPFEARPMLEVSGLGEITINGKSIRILESVSDFQIDCESMEAEDNSKIYCMDFPELSGGENEIVGDGSITALTVTPRWWTL